MFETLLPKLNAQEDHEPRAPFSLRGFISRRLSRQLVLRLSVVMTLLLALTAGVLVVAESRRMETDIRDKAILAAKAGARAYGAVLELGVDQKLFTVDDLIKPEYVRYATVNGDPRFHTKYDWYTDKYIADIEDEIFRTGGYQFASGIDLDTYVPTTNGPYREDPKPVNLTDPMDVQAKNYDFNKKYARRGMKYNSPIHREAARSVREYIVQPYTRDGVDCLDIGVPIIVKGQHYGAFRVGVTLASIAEQSRIMAFKLGVVCLFLIILTSLFLMYFVGIQIMPLEHLTALTQDMSHGTHLDRNLVSDQKNEIGSLTKAINRMRISLHHAMNMLDSKP